MEDDSGQARYNSMGQGTSQFEDCEIQEWDDDFEGGIEHLNNQEGDSLAPLNIPPQKLNFFLSMISCV